MNSHKNRIVYILIYSKKSKDQVFYCFHGESKDKSLQNVAR